jgi:exoribonuclease R
MKQKYTVFEEYGLPYNFDIDIILEAESISTEITEKEIAKRKDMRSKLTFTIDLMLKILTML